MIQLLCLFLLRRQVAFQKKLIQSIDRPGFGSKLAAMNFRNRSMKYESRPFRTRSDNFVFHRLQTSHRSASIRFPSPENRRVIVEYFDIVLPHMDVLNDHRKLLGTSNGKFPFWGKICRLTIVTDALLSRFPSDYVEFFSNNPTKKITYFCLKPYKIASRKRNRHLRDPHCSVCVAPNAM